MHFQKFGRWGNLGTPPSSPANNSLFFFLTIFSLHTPKLQGFVAGSLSLEPAFEPSCKLKSSFESLTSNMFYLQNVTCNARFRTSLWSWSKLGLCYSTSFTVFNGFFELVVVVFIKFSQVSIFAKNSCVFKMSLSASKTFRNGKFLGSSLNANVFSGLMSILRYTVWWVCCCGLVECRLLAVVSITISHPPNFKVRMFKKSWRTERYNRPCWRVKNKVKPEMVLL